MAALLSFIILCYEKNTADFHPIALSGLLAEGGLYKHFSTKL